MSFVLTSCEPARASPAFLPIPPLPPASSIVSGQSIRYGLSTHTLQQTALGLSARRTCGPLWTPQDVTTRRPAATSQLSCSLMTPQAHCSRCSGTLICSRSLRPCALSGVCVRGAGRDVTAAYPHKPCCLFVILVSWSRIGQIGSRPDNAEETSSVCGDEDGPGPRFRGRTTYYGMSRTTGVAQTSTPIPLVLVMTRPVGVSPFVDQDVQGTTGWPASWSTVRATDPSWIPDSVVIRKHRGGRGIYFLWIPARTEDRSSRHRGLCSGRLRDQNSRDLSARQHVHSRGAEAEPSSYVTYRKVIHVMLMFIPRVKRVLSCGSPERPTRQLSA